MTDLAKDPEFTFHSGRGLLLRRLQVQCDALMKLLSDQELMNSQYKELVDVQEGIDNSIADIIALNNAVASCWRAVRNLAEGK